MASFSEIEGWLSMLSTGIAGLRLLKEYGIRAPELEYFVENLGNSKIKVAAFAPPPLRNQYEKSVAKAETRLRLGIERMSETNVSDEDVDEVLKDTRELYSLLGDIRRATVSGIITV